MRSTPSLLIPPGLLGGLLGGLLASPAALAGPSAAATVALATGDCPTIVAELRVVETEALGLALARCQAGLGQPQEALRLLDGVRDPGLRPYERLVRGEVLLAAGRWAEAAAVLAEATLSGDAGERAAMLRGRALVEQGAFEEARAVLAPLIAGSLGEAGKVPGPGGADPGETRWWLAQGAIRRGEPDKAVPVMQKIWARNPSSPFAIQAEAWLTTRGLPVEDRSTDAGKALLRERIETMQKQRRYGEALALEDSLGVVRSASEEARLAFRAKDYPRAIAAFERISSPSPSQRFDHALATSRVGDHAGAARLYSALLAAAPSSSQADEASYKLGYLAYDKGELERAIPLLSDHLGRYPSSSFADDARWFIAWSQVRLGRLSEADQSFETFQRLHPKSDLAAYAGWWRAWILLQGGNEVGAKDAWQAVLNRWPTSGAAWLASKRLGQRTEGVPTRGPPPKPPAELQTDAWRRGTALAEAGLLEWARPELQSLIPAAKAAGPAGRVPLALALVEAGDYGNAKELAGPACGTPWRSPGDAWALRACYPRPQAELVSSIAVPAGLDPLLPYAIMNAESALKPWVASPAGARGLMQLMPAVAERHHLQRFRASPFSSDALFQPGYNAALGTAELVALRETFKGAGVEPGLPLVIAGYNGGAEAVQRWLALYPSPPEGERFAEDIGYTETRTYVRRVLGYLQQYRYVYGD